MSNIFIFVVIILIVIPSARAQRRLLDRLRGAGATRPESAVVLDGLGRWEANHLARFQRRGVITRTDAGAYYLNEPKLAEHQTRRVRALLIFAGVLLIGAGVLAWFVQRGR